MGEYSGAGRTGSGSPEVKGYSSGLCHRIVHQTREAFYERTGTGLVYLRALATIPPKGGSLGANWRGLWRTMEDLSLLQEPFEPTRVKLEFLEFLENTTLVNLGIVSKLCTFYERENDGVFEAG